MSQLHSCLMCGYPTIAYDAFDCPKCHTQFHDGERLARERRESEELSKKETENYQREKQKRRLVRIGLFFILPCGVVYWLYPASNGWTNWLINMFSVVATLSVILFFMGEESIYGFQETFTIFFLSCGMVYSLYPGSGVFTEWLIIIFSVVATWQLFKLLILLFKAQWAKFKNR